jgi:Arc/MetJ-type ribon-helix-helix transcriptional regulator
MSMEVTQVRLPEGILKEVDKLIERGIYTSKSDVVRDALRKLILEQQVGSVQNTNDSVKEIREIRKKLSKGIISSKDLKELNKLAD